MRRADGRAHELERDGQVTGRQEGIWPKEAYPYNFILPVLLAEHSDDRCISVSAPCPVDREQYFSVRFARWLQEALKDECPLCLQPHPVQIHTYVDRTYRDPEQQENGKDYAVVSIVVPRLHCIVNHRLSKHDGKQLQYTITVLPAFLAPYSVILVDKIHQAVDGYIGQKPECCTHQEAAFKIGCEDPVSEVLPVDFSPRRVGQSLVGLRKEFSLIFVKCLDSKVFRRRDSEYVLGLSLCHRTRSCRTTSPTRSSIESSGGRCRSASS